MTPATGAIAGRVLDAGGRPVSGATVAITGNAQAYRDIAAITTADGSFHFGGMAPGSYDLDAHKGPATGGARVVVVAGPPTRAEIRLA